MLGTPAATRSHVVDGPLSPRRCDPYSARFHSHHADCVRPRGRPTSVTDHHGADVPSSTPRSFESGMQRGRLVREPADGVRLDGRPLRPWSPRRATTEHRIDPGASWSRSCEVVQARCSTSFRLERGPEFEAGSLRGTHSRNILSQHNNAIKVMKIALIFLHEFFPVLPALTSGLSRA